LDYNIFFYFFFYIFFFKFFFFRNLKNQKNGQNNEIIICSSDSSNHQEVEKYYIRTAYLYESIKIKSKPMISNNLLLLKPEKDNCIIKGFSYINPIIIYIRVYKAIDG